MNLDQNGINIIKEFEGFKAYPYLDSAGLLTIGYGHLIKKGELFERDISIEEAEIILAQDAGFAINAVNNFVLVPLSQNQFNSLVSFVFNVGVGAFARSTMLGKINKKDYQGAFDEFKRWNKAGGNVVAGLVNRRRKEAALFLA